MQEVDESHHIFPLDFLQMLSVWEKTASLDTVTKKLTDQYTREVNYSLDNLTKWIEPLAILIAWVFVLWFAFAIFGAILKVTQTVS
jgi:type IV pilus assembly protein PilC